MKRSLIFCLLLATACKHKPGQGAGAGKDSGLQFSIDTAQARQMDSIAAIHRRTDSELLRRADSMPGINAGAGNFDIQTPAGWQRIDTMLGTIRAVMLVTPSMTIRFRTNVNIVSESMRGLSMDDYEKQTIGNLARYVEQFVLIGQGNRDLAGRHARWIHYAQSPGGLDLENICYIVPDKGIAYIITCSGLKGQLVRSRPQFEQAITSFRIH